VNILGLLLKIEYCSGKYIVVMNEINWISRN